MENPKNMHTVNDVYEQLKRLVEQGYGHVEIVIANVDGCACGISEVFHAAEPQVQIIPKFPLKFK